MSTTRKLQELRSNVEQILEQIDALLAYVHWNPSDEEVSSGSSGYQSVEEEQGIILPPAAPVLSREVTVDWGSQLLVRHVPIDLGRDSHTPSPPVPRQPGKYKRQHSEPIFGSGCSNA